MMFISDFHCHLYGYDRGTVMKALLAALSRTDDPMREFESGCAGKPGAGENKALSMNGAEYPDRKSFVFNHIRESRLWRSGALFGNEINSRDIKPPGCPNVITFIGIHPWDSSETDDNVFELLEKTADETGAFIGEIGLDRNRGGDRKRQLYVFEKALLIALERNIPFSLHCVREWGAMLSVLERYADQIKAPFMAHAYGGSIETMERLAGLGGYISFGAGPGGSFYPKAKDCLRQIAPERLLLETDFTANSEKSVSVPGGMTGKKQAAGKTGNQETRGLPEDADEKAASGSKPVDKPAGGITENKETQGLQGDAAEAAERYCRELAAVYFEAAGIRGENPEKLRMAVNSNGEVFKAYTAYR